jgi:histidinol-phosphate aminotransferase
MMALAKPRVKVMAPTPTFVMYDMTARFVGMQFISVPLNATDFSLDVNAMVAAIEQHQPAVIFLAYPNNPTGNLFAASDIESVLSAAEGLVVIDEAYHAFAGRSFMAHLAEYDNIVVMRTVSKLGLAGLRLGLLVGASEWLAEFDKVRLPYNINSLTQTSAEFALANIDFLEQQTAEICQARDSLSHDLSQLDAVEVWPSRTNFILFRVKEQSAETIFDGLRQRGVLIKNLDKADPVLKGCLRVTVGTRQENEAFLAALAEIV